MKRLQDLKAGAMFSVSENREAGSRKFVNGGEQTIRDQVLSRPHNVMNWFFEHRDIQSEKNGTISVTNRMGRATVMVDGCEQTGSEVHAMWASALEVIARYRGLQKTKSVLLLGLGGGGEIKNYYRAFPHAMVTAVEYDPAMIALAKELKLYAPYPAPRIICEDAAIAVEKLSETFDLVVVDLFKGPVPSPLASNDEFLASLEKRLADDGLLIVNVYKNDALLSHLSEKFLRVRKWTFGLNHLALFEKREVVRAFSNGYLPVREWPDQNTAASTPAMFNPSSAGEKGTYWRLWPFSFELYKGDDEPKISPLPKEKSLPVRIVMWQRLLKGDVPPGWRAFSPGPEYKIGFIPLSEGHEKRWSESARRSLKKWSAEEGKTYAIEEIDYAAFRTAYMKSDLPVTMKSFTANELKTKLQNPHTQVRMLGVRRISDGKIVAGIACLESKSVPSSFYHSGFFLKDADNGTVIPGLFDRWFKDARTRGVRFIDLGNFWTPGKDGDWKGFSLFKAKFNPLYFFYPPRLFCFSLNGD